MTRDGQNIFDYCVSELGDVNNFMNLIYLNDLDPDSDIEGGMDLELPSLITKEKYVTSYNSNPLELIKTIKDNQSVFDLSVQYFGDIKYLFTLLSDNNLEVNQDIQSGMDLIINNINVGNEVVKTLYIKNNIYPTNNQNQTASSVVSGDYNNDYGNDHF